MRRSRTALTAWPAFADMMTVLAVLGLATAAGVAVVGDPGGDEDRIPALKAKLAAVRQLNASLEAELAAAQQRIEEIEKEVARRVLGSMPCLGTRPGSRTAPVPLLRILVDSGYQLTRQWPEGANVEGIPRLDEAIAHGLMHEDDLLRYARGMYEYGGRADTYGGDCRFWVELGKGETVSQATCARAYGLVSRYFLISNSSEVNEACLIGKD